MFQVIATHHARAEHVEDFLAFMRRVIEHVGEAPGLIEFTGWRETQTTTLIGLSRWESPEAFQAALPLIMGLADERRPEWSEKPDDLLTFTPA